MARKCLRRCRECGYEEVTAATQHTVRRADAHNYPHWKRRRYCGIMRVVRD